MARRKKWEKKGKKGGREGPQEFPKDNFLAMLMHGLGVN